jgi:high-affinity iron transporter
VIPNLLIGLREGLEAVLVVSVLVAYLVKSDRRSQLPFVWVGTGVAVAVSLGFGALLTFGPQGLSGEAEDAIAGSLAVLAVVFVTWMIFWMAKASRTLATDLRAHIDAGATPWSLVLLAALAVGREGLETAFFLWAATRSALRDGVPRASPSSAR